MNKKEILMKLAFTFICIFTIGVINVNALTVEVANEQQLKAAVDGRKEVDGVNATDTNTTEVKLVEDITLTSYLEIVTITDLTLDLNGHTIDGETKSQSVGITYGGNDIENFTSGGLTIKDSSVGKLGKIISYKTIWITNNNTNTTSTKNFKLTIEGGNFYSLYVSDATMFTLSSSENYMKDKNITFDLQVKDGYFDARGSQAIFLNAGGINADNITLNVNYDKLTFKGTQSRLIYADKTFTVDDVVSADSNIKLKYSTLNKEGTLTDRALSATEYNAFWDIIGNYDIIEITKKEGFDVSNVTLNGTYGYTTLPEGAISIKNRGTNSLKIKTVSVRTNGTGEELFEIVGPKTAPTLTAGTTDNTSYKVKAKDGLNAGTYTATITVTDENDKTYTSTVTLTVARKPLGEISVSKDGWTYDGTAHTGYTKSGLDSVPSDKYLIEYSIKNADEWSTAIPKTANTYTIRLTITDSNLEEKSVESDFVIAKNNKEIQIIANSHEWTYDSHIQTDEGYTIKYDGTVVTDGVLPTGDTISAIIDGSVKDVKDTVTGNNVVREFNIQNRDSYSNITTTNGTLTIKPITTEIIVTADSDTKVYDGSVLTKDSYTFTSGIVKTGDTLKATITGSQTYVGTSNNIVSDVKVIRGSVDISGNYTFGTHVNGSLTVTTATQNLEISDQYVTIGGTLLTSELEAALTGAKGNVSFEQESGTAGTYDDTNYGGFRAGNTVGEVIMKVKSTSSNLGGDETPEYSEATKTFKIKVVSKETVTISGITNNQEFTYDGNAHTPTGTITVTDNKVNPSTLEVSYAGTGSTTYSSTTAPKNAGTYSVTYKVPNSNATYTGQVTFNFTINKAKLTKVTLKQNSYEYNNDVIMTEPVNYDIDKMSYSGNISAKNVGSYTITISLKDKDNYEWSDGTNSNLTLNWSIIKADPDYEIPTNLTGLKGQKLSDITLPSGFTWNDASTSLIVGTHTYKATYTPSDTNNYNFINNIDIKVVTKDIFNVTTKVNGGNGTINGPFMNVVEGTKKEIIFTPEVGFMIDKVKVNGVETTITNNKLTLTVDENKNIEVSYKKIPFTITVVDIEGATIDPDGVFIVNYGDSKDFTIYANYGYKFIKVLVNGVDKTDEMIGDTLTLNNITANMEIEVVVEKIVYEVIDGANQTYTTAKDNEAKFRIDAEYGLFMQGGKVYVDDELIEEDNYTTEKGSTIITLKQSYLDKLNVGKHTLKVTFADGGVATTNFTIAKEVPVVNNPKTSDNIMLYITTGIISVIGLIGASLFVIRRKQEN